MISFRVSRGEIEFVFTLHAIFRAEERNIDGATLREIVHTGKFKRFGKNGVKIVKQALNGKVALVGWFVKPNFVTIITVEKSG